jgi:hypothetical protein
MEFISMRLCFFSAEIYNKKLKETDKAKPLYEKIISQPQTVSTLWKRKKLQAIAGRLIYKRLTV